MELSKKQPSKDWVNKVKRVFSVKSDEQLCYDVFLALVAHSGNANTSLENAVKVMEHIRSIVKADA